MPQNERRSLILTRPSVPVEPFELGQRLADVPPAVLEENVIRLRDGHVLISTTGDVDSLQKRMSTTFGDAIHEHAIIEPDRRLFRVAPMFAEAPRPERKLTWNLEAIGITNGKQATGKGAIVAVLDSGLDFSHPDFRQVRGVRIVDNDAFDSDGHGTFCAGIINGPKRPRHQDCPRYGVAPDAELIAINVYDGNGNETSDGNLLRGIIRAAELGAHVISLSVGRVPTNPEPRIPLIFDMIGQILMEYYDTIIVAAAGNESDRREGFIGPIVQPADAPSFIAVAAVNEQLQPALSSSGGIDGQRAPSIAAPGVGIFSSYRSRDVPPGQAYITLNGTSAATPHVAGVAALWVEKGFKGRQLKDQLLGSYRPLATPNGPRDVGVGLVQAPQ